MPLRRHQHMQAQPVGIALLAGNVAMEGSTLVKPTASDAVVITHRDTQYVVLHIQFHNASRPCMPDGEIVLSIIKRSAD